ncbi:MAG: hypothetical protein AUI15_28245 [Actinobacteria bacterium 13_2_20CM_2_66_6]|nr:MAG: hypothetical protein AUI15_28245 [Actinobacteria bacterium 13_2_20CM_2_66_6]
MTVERAAELLSTARRAVALTGAGVSAESGIPTFRGEGGLWAKYDPVKVSSIDTFLADPASYWRVSRDRGRVAGSGRKVVCLDCGRVEPRSEVQERLDVEMPPRCRQCGGTRLKPTVVLFGEPMPAAAVQESFELARNADVILVVGSSLVVYPAAEVPLVALRAGARMIVVNAEPTPFDRFAHVVIHGRSGEVLPQLAALVAER